MQKTTNEKKINSKDMWDKLSNDQINDLVKAMRTVNAISIRMIDGYEYNITSILRTWASIKNGEYIDRGILKNGNLYIVSFYIDEWERMVDSTKDIKKAYELRDLAENKMRDGNFLEWLEEYKKNKKL